MWRKPKPPSLPNLAPSETQGLSPGPTHCNATPGYVGGVGHTEACPQKTKSFPKPPVDLDELDRWVRIGWERRRSATASYAQTSWQLGLVRTDRGAITVLLRSQLSAN
jgi:hypothetical protein